MVQIITDSGSDLSLAEAQALGVRLVPMTVRFGDNEYTAGVNMTNDQFYEMLANSQELPTTSQPTPYQFEQAFEEVVSAGDEAVVICLSSALSGTYQSANIAASDYDGIYVVDSLNVTVSQLLLVKYALMLAGQDLGAADIAARLEEAKAKICIYGAVDTLEYLIKGGRLSKAAGMVGNLLNIRPVLHINESGALVVAGKGRGQKGAFKMVNDFFAKNDLDFSLPCCMGYTGTDRSNLDAYLEASGGLWKDADVSIHTIGCTIGTHAGPGLIAMACFKK